MTQATRTSPNRKSTTLTLAYLAAGLASVSFAGHELGAVNRTAAGYQAIVEGGQVLGLYGRQFEAVEAIKTASF